MAKVIMIQGTTSNAGKSLTVAALCRIFKQDGYKVAPFKSQNMTSNSCIDQEGLEMGVAQAMQAEAAGIKPDARMNPILLKPTGDKSAQVVLNGEIFKDMSASRYYNYKKEMIPHIEKAYNSLAEEYDIVVIEGAGSPAEINLRENDIVNMGMAKLVNAPVIIVGDIDRGGVFASLAGTMLLLEDEEKVRVKGFVINKFRGDVNLLLPGLKMLEEITKVEVLGVVPYMNVDIDDEDSLSDSKKQSFLHELEGLNLKKYKESQYDILADCVRRSLNMEKIYEITGIKR
jgi:adenosylcobyric acid synthase